MFPKVDPAAINLLKNTLRFSPNDRFTIDEILNQPFYEKIRRKELEQNREPIVMNP